MAKVVGLSEKDKKEICKAYYVDLRTLRDIAKEYDVSHVTIHAIVSNPKMQREYKRRAESSKIRNELRLAQASEDALDKQIELLQKPLDDAYLYINQNAARDIMDRVGLRAKDESKQDVTITFGVAGIPEVNMPETGGDQDAEL